MSNAVRALLLLAVLVQHAAAQERAWNFQVSLDDKPVGFQHFVLREQGGERTMSIEARLEVKVLFLTVYTYTHTATERWRGDCLRAIDASTDDNGERFRVESTRADERLQVRTTAKTGVTTETIDGCPFSFAYWNPALLGQTRLLNSQTGVYEQVAIVALGDTTIAVRGQPTPARHYRIDGLKNPIELWYSADGEWLALQARVAGGRLLRYRRQ